MKIQFSHKYKDIISLENLLAAWQEFVAGKKNKQDVQDFSRRLFDNILSLHKDLENGSYQHGGYKDFYIADPKPRHIHKAPVRDRLLHHAIYRLLYPFFDRIFIADSFSCRNNKGTHRALKRFQKMIDHVSLNKTRTCWILKCDIKKFFDSVDHNVLIQILREYIPDSDIMSLLKKIIESYSSGIGSGAGLPLGNLTSQLFSNIYLNVFDQWIKHKLKAKNYIRYCDDFVILSFNKQALEKSEKEIQMFLAEKLKLNLHPEKTFVKTAASGMDFLGWIHFSDYRVLRRATRKRMMNRIAEHPTDETLQSYLGMLRHGNGWKLVNALLNEYWLKK
ncbi:MAG: reverse transcriptase/maturase family protein [Parcubacteria group bacterium]